MESRIIIAIGGCVVGFAGGYFTARFMANRKLDEQLATAEQEANEYWKKRWQELYAKPALEDLANEVKGDTKVEGAEFATPLTTTWLAERMQERAEVLALLDGEVEEYNQTDNDEPEEVITVEELEQNVFEEASKTQDPTVPRIISIDEFMEDCQDYDKICITYFDGDGNAIDNGQQTPIDNLDSLIGSEFEEHWGKKSKDPNVVYVRNVALEVDFEITRDPRTFEEWILGPMPKSKWASKKSKEDD